MGFAALYPSYVPVLAIGYRVASLTIAKYSERVRQINLTGKSVLIYGIGVKPGN
ncbi:hypothetical protein ABIE49_001205 [Bradyrhizobium sp. OAE829]